MKTPVEILSEVYSPAFWWGRDQYGGYCCFCGTAEEQGELHHYAECLLRQIRIHLMEEITRGRRTSEAADRVAAWLKGSPWRTRQIYREEDEPAAAEYEAMAEANEPLPDVQCPTDPGPERRHPTPIYLGNNPSGSTVVLPPEKSPLVKEIEAIIDGVFAPVLAPTAKELLDNAQVQLKELTAPPVDPATVTGLVAGSEVVPKVEPEFLHSWQATGKRSAVRCVNCGLISLAGVPAGILAGGVCPGETPTAAVPVEVKAVAPAVPLVQVTCPRCRVCETVPATGGALPDLPQITLEGPFMVVGWVHPAHGQQAGVYCKACWMGTVNSIVTGILPCAVVLSPSQGPGQSA